MFAQAGPRSKLYSGDAEGIIKIWMRKAALGWNYECLCTVNQYKVIIPHPSSSRHIRDTHSGDTRKPPRHEPSGKMSIGSIEG